VSDLIVSPSQPEPEKSVSAKKDALKAFEARDQEFSIGSYVIDDRGSVYRIRNTKYDKHEKREEVELESWSDVHHGDGSVKAQWCHYGDISLSDFESGRFLKIDQPIEELEKTTLAEMSDLSQYEDDEPLPSTSTAISIAAPKEKLERARKQAQLVANKVEIMRRVLERKSNALRRLMEGHLAKVKKLAKIINIIELYLGVEEEIVQLVQGVPASSDIPISFRQQILFMDEEIALVEPEGIDFQDIDKFDQWLTSDPKHLSQVLPEEKGVVVIRVRRTDKNYFEDREMDAAMHYQNFVLNLNNKAVYILIRNGENVYRIWSEKLQIWPRLFPKRAEMDELMKIVENDQELRSKRHIWESDREKAEEQLVDYRKHLLLMQGLLDRTTVFHPMPHVVSFFKPETWGTAINLIYDDDLSLPSGRLSFQEWHKELNQKLDRGSRIFITRGPYLTNKGGAYHAEYYSNRTLFYNSPSPSWHSVYSVIRTEPSQRSYHDKDEIRLVINYKATDKVYPDDYYQEAHERKNALPYFLYKDDDFVFNYDALSLEDIEFYLNSRVDRQHYLSMMPILLGLRAKRREEMKWEREFVSAMAGRLQTTETAVWEAVEWWKNKVIWKRPLSNDDSLAWRMVEGRLKKLSS
jgi:hypothetical protein